MGDITNDIETTIDYLVDEAFTFGHYVINNYMQEFLLFMLLGVVATIVWRTARRFLGRG